MPEAGTVGFEDARLVHEFEDGWKIVDLYKSDDLDKLGAACRNCWVGDNPSTGPYSGRGSAYSWVGKVLPGPENEEPGPDALELARKRWDRPEYRKAHGDAWVETRIKNDAEKPIAGKRNYKLLAILNPEGQIVGGACLGLLETKALITYGSCDDLCQHGLSWVVLDGFKFVVLQLGRNSELQEKGSGFNLSGAGLDHLVEWYKGACEGEWQESKALAKQRVLA